MLTKPMTAKINRKLVQMADRFKKDKLKALRKECPFGHLGTFTDKNILKNDFYFMVFG